MSGAFQYGVVKRFFAISGAPYGYITPANGGADIYFRPSDRQIATVIGRECTWKPRDYTPFTLKKGDRVIFCALNVGGSRLRAIPWDFVREEEQSLKGSAER